MTLPSCRRPRFGLVLSGGAVRGAAHVGVLEVLEEAGLAPDLLVGTSAGAIIGAASAAGRPTARIADVARRLDWFSLVGPTLHFKTALLGTRQLEVLLRDDLGLTTFEVLERPFCAVACDLGSGQAVTLESGDLVRAVMASTAVPGLFPPQELDGRRLVDGGIVANLHVDAARRMGADFVVAVDLLPIGAEPAAADHLFEIWQRSLYLLIRGNHTDHGEADLTLTPDVAPFSFTDFREVEALIDRGRAAALEALPTLRAALAAPG